MKRALSLLLTLAMVLSLGVLPASAADIEIVDVNEPEQEIDAVNYPAQQFSYYEPNGLSIDVKAPAGALPRGTTMEVSRLEDLSRVQNAVDRADDLSGYVALAADISFWNDGEEVEPVDGNKILVTMTAPEIAELDNPVVVHVPDEEPAVAERIDPMPEDESALRMGDQISFEAESFSVYAVIGDNPPTARATVQFFKNYTDTTPIATIYVKEADTRDELNEIVYDPGVGDLADNLLFEGWCKETDAAAGITLSTPKMNIDQVRDDLYQKTITADTTVKYYAVIYKYYTVGYYAEGLCYGQKTLLLMPSETNVDFTVSMNYTPPSGEQNFAGWKISEGLSNVVSPAGATASSVYPNGTAMTIKGSIKFDVDAPMGHWLVFHESDKDGNPKGATYIAPQFIKAGENTKEPTITMTCPGYTFAGWYVGDADGNEISNTQFTFNGELEETVHLWAKWNSASSVSYTWIIWKENIDGDGYDYEASGTLSGTPGSTQGGVTSTGSGNDAYARVNNQNKQYTGFHLNTDKFDTEKTKTIAADGSTVINIYYDRNVYKLTFRTTASGAIEYKTISGYELAYSGSNYYIKINGNWYQFRNEGYYVWNATSIDSTPTPGQYITYTWNGRSYSDARTYTTTSTLTDNGLVKTIEAKYETNISSNFPITGYPEGTRWMPQTPNNPGWSQVMVYIETMPAGDVTFVLDTESRPTKTINYYVEALADDEDKVSAPYNLYSGTGNTLVHPESGMQFVLYTSVKAKYNGVTMEDLLTLNGFTLIGADSQGETRGSNNTFFYIYDSSSDGTLNLYYTRQKYTINYMDGAYFTGGNGTTPYTPTGNAFTPYSSDAIPFNDDISSYGPDGDNYETPTNANNHGFYFAGWYADQTCQGELYDFDKMPLDGVTVYAKWVQLRYRVFLKPNVPTSDTTLYWGSDTQQMNFGIGYGGKVSTPTGTRTGYEFIGWFTDEARTDVFNAEFISLTDDTVPANPAYDKTVDMTDQAATYTDSEGKVVHYPMDKYGNINDAGYNSDAARPWVQRKLVLYADWRKVAEGAKGVGVIYDAGEQGENAPTDNSLYPDNTDAVAQGAATPKAENMQFLYWVVQKWVGDDATGSYQDTDVHVYPGDNFKVLIDNSKRVIISQDPTTGKITEATYTVQLRAEYGPKQVPTPSHIYWYANNETSEVQKDENVQINIGVDIPTTANYNPGNRALGLSYEGHVFLGWARVTTGTEVTPTSLGASDLFLKWVPVETEEGGGHYLAQDSTGTWVKVTQVACDEKNPYHDLYAVWGSAFYVYHSGTKQVERIIISGTVSAFDLTKLVDTSSFLYGGYYASYAGASEAFAANAESLNWTQVESVSGYNDVAQINGFASQGFVAKATDTKGTAYDGTNVTWSNPITAAGNAITPAANTVYYIKEVPAGVFLQPKLRYTYRAADGGIGTAWLFTNTDDTSYLSAGFRINGSDNEGAFATSFTITPLRVTDNAKTFYVGTAPDGAVNPTKLYTKGAQFSWLMVYNNPNLYEDPSLNVPGEVNILADNATMLMYWVTPDGATVTSIAKRVYSSITSAYSIGAESSVVSSTITFPTT